MKGRVMRGVNKAKIKAEKYLASKIILFTGMKLKISIL